MTGKAEKAIREFRDMMELDQLPKTTKKVYLKMHIFSGAEEAIYVKRLWSMYTSVCLSKNRSTIIDGRVIGIFNAVVGTKKFTDGE